MTKPTKWHVCPAKTQISLGIHPDWSESLLCAQWVAKDPSFLQADSEDSDQTERMPRLIWVFTGCICHFVGFVMRWPNCVYIQCRPWSMPHYAASDLGLHYLPRSHLWDARHTLINTSKRLYMLKWTTSWQNQQNDCAPSDDSDQPGHPPSLIRVFAIRMKEAWVLSYPLSTQRRLIRLGGSQADLSLRWVYSHFVGFVIRRLKWRKTDERSECNVCFNFHPSIPSQESACFCRSLVVVSLTFFNASVFTKSISWYSVGCSELLAPTGDLIGCSKESSWSRSMYFNSDSLLLPGAGGVVSQSWKSDG